MPPPRDVNPNSCGQRNAGPVDSALAVLAEGQYGVVSREQLGEMGLGRREIEYRLEVGRLHRLHRGVYAVGHRVLSREGRWLGAVMAGGAGAVLSHRSAAALWGIRATAAAEIDVSVRGQRRARPGVRFRRARPRADEVTVHRRIPVTTVERTLVDIAARLRPHQLRKAIEEAEILRLGGEPSLDAVVRRYATRKGVRRLAEITADRTLGETVTRSELEDRFLAFVDRAGLPAPRTNQLVEGFEVDCLWREQRLVVELDGRAFHGTSDGFERDRERDRLLQAAGWRVIRLTWRQLHLDGAGVARDLAGLLPDDRR